MKRFLAALAPVVLLAALFAFVAAPILSACNAAQGRLVLDVTQRGLETCALEAPSTDEKEVAILCGISADALPWLRTFLASKAKGIARYAAAHRMPLSLPADAGADAAP